MATLAGPVPDQTRSPLARFNLALGLGNSSNSNDKKVKADGQAAKRRGPKPDSKPALTRRQELNRQAQRTHRERKELYIKCLEQEVMQIKETFQTCVKERDAWEAEARRLTDILNAHGIQIAQPLSLSPPSGHPTSSGSSGSYPSNSASTSATTLQSVHSGGGYFSPARPPMPQSITPPANMPNAQPVTNVDYDQTGIDFVLALEKPCMDHMQMLCVASQHTTEDAISGHALMATCPTRNHLIERPDVDYGHRMPDMKAIDLLKLLDLSNRLPLGSEVTPVMAWACVFRHPYMRYLQAEDFIAMKDDLLGKVRCYGFGAVIEEFEVEEAIEMALDRKNENNVNSMQV